MNQTACETCRRSRSKAKNRSTDIGEPTPKSSRPGASIAIGSSRLMSSATRSIRGASEAVSTPTKSGSLSSTVPAKIPYNPQASYYDQTDIYRLQREAHDAGYSNIILIVFDGMDWDTARAASIYKTGRVSYDSGRGMGLAFQDDRRVMTDYGFGCHQPGRDGRQD